MLETRIIFKHISRITSFILAAGVLCLLASCGRFPTNDYQISLPYNYSIVRTQEGVVGVANPESVVIVEANVDGYRVYNDVVAGHVSKCKEPWIQSEPGYFIVEFKSGKVYKKLSKKQWLAKLRLYGIHHAPVLHYPSGSDEANGFNKPINP